MIILYGWHYGESSISLVFSFIADILPPRHNILLCTARVHVKISGVRQQQTFLSLLRQHTPTRSYHRAEERFIRKLSCSSLDTQAFLPILFPLHFQRALKMHQPETEESHTVLIGNGCPFTENKAEKPS